MPQRADLDVMREVGRRAAERNTSLPALLVSCLRELEAHWPQLASRTGDVTVLATVRRVIEAIAEGHERAQQASADHEAAIRRQFIDDLLGGAGYDPIALARRAERFGVLLSGGHVVAIAQRPAPFVLGDRLVRRVETSLVTRFGSRNVLITVREGMLVCVTPSTLRGVPGELAHQLIALIGPDTGWRVGVGRQHTGAGGVMHSYEEARNALHVAERLGLRATVLNAADLLVFPVLLRDRSAITDLIATVLGPLADAKGGAQPLLATLSAFFDNQGNTAATARCLGISVRAIGYRLDRIARMTGYAPTEPTQRFTLEAAVLGARLLDWPAQPLP